MGCGCGGSTREPSARQARQARQKPKRDGAGATREAVSFSDEGFVWNGPPRPESPAPAPAAQQQS